MMKVFGLFDSTKVRVEDPGLKRVVNFDSKLLLKSHGRIKWDPSKQKVNIVERLINLVGVPGSRGKKHKIITGWATGNYSKNAKIVIEALKMIEKKTGKNPIEVFAKALDNAAPREEVTAIEYGGARYPQAVDISPRRRINLVLRFFVHGAYDKAFNKKTTMTEALAKELMFAAENSSESFAISKKNDLEKQADAAR